MTKAKHKELYTEMFHQSFGDNIMKKSESTIQIATINTNTFLIKDKDPCKHDTLKREIIEMETDILGLTELNYNWTCVKHHHQLHTQT